MIFRQRPAKPPISRFIENLWFQVSCARGVNTFNSLIKRVGDDAYDFTVYQPGGEKPLIAVHYVRK